MKNQAKRKKEKKSNTVGTVIKSNEKIIETKS